MSLGTSSVNVPNMTVAITEAPITHIPLIAVKIMTKNAVQRLKTESRTMNIMTKERHAPVRKRANIYKEAVWMISTMSVRSEGNSTVEQLVVHHW